MLIYKQTTPSTEWLITHNAEFIPSVNVTVMHGGKLQMILPLSVEIVDAVTVKVTFSAPHTGTAVIRSGGI